MRIKKVEINIIPPKNQRYITSGDWQFQEDKLIINVSDLKNWKEEIGIMLHEFLEALLCENRGISEEVVTNWDLMNLDLKEPGEDKNAPYYKEHQIANKIERLFLKQLK